MTARVYLVLADTAKPLEPSFKSVPGGKLTGAFEILPWEAFCRLDWTKVAALAAGLAQAARRTDLLAAIGGPDDINDNPHEPPAMPWPEGEPDLPDQNHFDPEEA